MKDVTVQTEQVPKPNPPRLPSIEDALAIRIQLERQRRGWSADELARRMTEGGVPINPSAIWRIENATPRRKITVDEAVGFARVFGVDVADLIGQAPDGVARNRMIDAVVEIQEAEERFRDAYQELVDVWSASMRVLDMISAGDEAILAVSRGRELITRLEAEYPWLGESDNG